VNTVEVSGSVQPKYAEIFEKIMDLVVNRGVYNGMHPFGVTWGYKPDDVPVMLLHNAGANPWNTKIPFNKIDPSLIGRAA